MVEQIQIPADREQMKLPGVDGHFLDERLDEARKVIKKVAELSSKPLVIQFSGGKDSMALLDLVRGVTHWFVCAYMATGTELPGVVNFVRDYCKEQGIKLLVSNPSMHKGNLFKRIERFQRFPLVEQTWCCRDLKLRPQKKLLIETFGKGTYYKLEGVRRFESTRRRYIYAAYANDPMREDGEFKGSYEVFPILNWTDDDVKNYLALRGLIVMKQYADFKVSGCSWCPFYGPDIYYTVLQKMPEWYDRFIALEEKLQMPSVLGEVYLRDIKAAVLEGRECPKATTRTEGKQPCTMLFRGERVRTCDVYGHLFLGGKCFRCEMPQPTEAVHG